MRIACVHVPQFALQCLTRIDASLRGAPVAVVGSDAAGTRPGVAGRTALFSPVVLACSRAAWARGVRLGMTATATNSIAPGELRVVTADAGLERETIRAIADALLAVSPLVDLGGRVGAGGAHLAIYCEVPSKTRGASFGDRLLDVLDMLGLTARVGIADDRFTAWVAAAHPAPTTRKASERSAGAEASGASGASDERGVVSVPRGGSAAFLAPRPLSLLAITPEVQHMLEALGVRTLGEFAALPAPSVARPLEADYQALARGESSQVLRPYAPEAPIREEVIIDASSLPSASGLGTRATGMSVAGAVGTLAQRVAVRLAGRSRGAARLEIMVSGAGGDRVLAVTPGMQTDRALPVSALAEPQRIGPRVVDSAEDLAHAIGTVLDEDHGAVWRMRVTVIGEAIAGETIEPALPTGEEVVADAALDVLGVVLSNPGTSDAWRLTHPGHASQARLRDERRDAHRRTQRGKHDRGHRGRADVVQGRLPLGSRK